MADQKSQTGVYDFTSHTPIVYPHLVKPRKYKEGTSQEGKPYFEITWVLTPDQYRDTATLAANVAREAFPGRDLKTLRFPFSKGDDFASVEGKKNREWARGKYLLQCRSPAAADGVHGRPHLAVVLNGKVVKIDRDDTADVAANQRYFFNGVECVGSVNFTSYEGFNGGIKAYINQLMSLNKGEKIASGVDLEDKFGGYVGITSDEDPTKSGGLDDIL